MPPQPRSASSASSRTVSVTFGPPRPFVTSRCRPRAASTKWAGVKSPGGVFTQSRVPRTAPVTTCASSNAATVSACRACGLSTLTVPGAVESSLVSRLNAVNV